LVETYRKGVNTPLSSCADKRKCYSDFAEKVLSPRRTRKKKPAAVAAKTVFRAKP